MPTCYKNATKYIHLLLLHERISEINYFIQYYTDTNLKINQSKRLSIINHLKEYKRTTTDKYITNFFLERIGTHISIYTEITL